MAQVHPALLASDEERLLRPRRWCGRGLAVAAILTASQAIFGGYAIIVKIAINSSVDTLVFSLLRDIGASVVLLSACALMGERRPIAPGDRATFVGVGLFGITISQTAMVLALQWVPPFNASLLQPTQPVLTLLLALCVRMETLNICSAAGALKVAGIVIGCAGATFTVLTATERKPAHDAPSSGSISGMLLGNTLLVLQCAGGAVFQLLNKRLTGRYPSITVAAYGYGLGTLMLAVVVLPMRAADAGAWRLPAAGYAALAYAVLLASAFNYFAYAWAARRSSASHVTAFFPLQVVFAALLQVLVLGEWPSATQVAGAAAIVVALLCVVASLAYDDSRPGGGVPKEDERRAAADE